MADNFQDDNPQTSVDDIAYEIKLAGGDPHGFNNPLGQYGISNLDFVAGQMVGFGEFFRDTPSLAMGFDTIANRMLVPNRGAYGADQQTISGIVTAPGQYDPFNTRRGSGGSQINLERGKNAAIRQITTGDPGFTTTADAAHYNAIVAAMTGVFGTGEQRGVARGADSFVGAVGLHINREMSAKMVRNGVISAPGGASRFLNQNETLGPDELGMGPALGGPEGFPAFGPEGPPMRPNDLPPPVSPYRGGRVNGGDVAGYDTAGIAFDAAGNPLGNSSISRGLQEQLRWLQQRYTPEAGEGVGPYNAADFAGRYAYEGDLRPQDAAFLAEIPGSSITREGRYVLPTDYAAAILGLDPDASDYAGRYDTSGTPSLEDARFLQQNPQFTLAKGGANTGYGYTQDPSGAYVPNTTGAGGDQRFQQQGGAEPTPVPGDWNYIPKPGDWNYIPPATTPPGFTPASTINGFSTPTTPVVEPHNSYPWTNGTASVLPTPVPNMSINPAADASTIPGANVQVFDPVVPSSRRFLGGLPSTPLGSSGVSPSTVGPGGIASPFPNDPNNGGGTTSGFGVRTAYPGDCSLVMP